MKWLRLLDELMTAFSFYKQVKTELEPTAEERRADEEKRDRRERRRKRDVEAAQAKHKDK